MLDTTLKKRRTTRHCPDIITPTFHRVLSPWSWIKTTTCIALTFLVSTGNGFSSLTTTTTSYIKRGWSSCILATMYSNRRTTISVQDDDDDDDDDDEARRPLQEEYEDSFKKMTTRTSHCSSTTSNDRRSFLQKYIMIAASSTTGLLTGTTARAASDGSSSSATAEVTDKIYIMVKGLKSGNAETITTASGSVQPQQPQQTRRIVIGLFGKDAPQTVAKIKALVLSSKQGGGLAAPCKPRAERSLQKEQLEANKVYNACIEGQDQGVTLAYSSIWRIIPNERIDFGAVSGKFVAREYPNFDEESSVLNTNLKHDIPGVVSVRRGNDGGFGFTICPGGGATLDGNSNSNSNDVAYLDEDHIVVGRVLQGMDVVQEINAVPVIASSKVVNYMALTGGTTTKNAPNRSCRYGGPMYCNENKPLLKLSITETGIL